MSAHTPTPWRIATRDSSEGFFIVEQNGGERDDGDRSSYRVAHVIDYNDRAENEANARLIAAAPELLAALRETLRVLEACTTAEYSKAIKDDAHAAIAKATGSGM